MKRKRENGESPERQLVVSTSTNHSVPGFQSLSDETLAYILEWIRPSDEDPRIWIWICRICATCKFFRDLLRMDTEEVPRLMPTAFMLVPDSEYLGISSRWLSFSLSIKLMETIRNSDWIGLNVRRVVAETMFSYGYANSAIQRGLKLLLTTPQLLPKLAEIYIKFKPQNLLDAEPPFPVDNTLLPRIAAVHPDLTKLSLLGCFGQDPELDVISPESFASLTSLRCLQHFGIKLFRAQSGIPSWFGNEHLNAILSSLSPSLTSLVLDTWNCDIYPSNGSIIDSTFSKRLWLSTFRVHFCGWVNDDTIMNRLRGQIEAFGKVHLTTIGIGWTSVTLDGLRTFMNKWKQADHVLPMRVEGPFLTLVAEFPEVEFHNDSIS